MAPSKLTSTPLLLTILLATSCSSSSSTTDLGSGAPDTDVSQTGMDAETNDLAAADSGQQTASDAGGLEDAGSLEDAGVVAPLNILFLGNSYTYGNQLPQLVQTISEAEGTLPQLKTEMMAAGGLQLKDHLARPAHMQALESGNFNVVVLQGQSVEPLLVSGEFQTAARTISDRATAAGVAVRFFETWARREGHLVYQEAWSGGDPKTMQAGLRAAYSQAAQAGGGEMIPVGDAFELSLQKHPELIIHAPDGSHPSILGSYLAACVFYGFFTRQAIKDFTVLPEHLDRAEAEKLAAVANEIIQAL